MAITPTFVDGTFAVGAVGKHTRTNVLQHENVTVVWPPRTDGGYSLIVDGRAEVADSGLTVTPTKAILHRRATSDSVATSPDGLHDCVPLKK